MFLCYTQLVLLPLPAELHATLSSLFIILLVPIMVGSPCARCNAWSRGQLILTVLLQRKSHQPHLSNGESQLQKDFRSCSNSHVANKWQSSRIAKSCLLGIKIAHVNSKYVILIFKNWSIKREQKSPCSVVLQNVTVK